MVDISYSITPVFPPSRAGSFLLRTPANHGAHVARRAGFRQGRLEDLMNFWILVFVFDLTAALFDVYLDGLFVGQCDKAVAPAIDRKSTRLNSSHVKISYAVFCLTTKKKRRRSSERTEPTSMCSSRYKTN